MNKSNAYNVDNFVQVADQMDFVIIVRIHNNILSLLMVKIAKFVIFKIVNIVTKWVFIKIQYLHHLIYFWKIILKNINTPQLKNIVLDV